MTVWRGFTAHSTRSSKRFIRRPTVRPSDRPTGFRSRQVHRMVAASRAKPGEASSWPHGVSKSFSHYSPSPSFPRLEFYIAVCDCSAFATLGALTRFQRSGHAQFGAVGRRLWRLAPAASWSPSQDASPRADRRRAHVLHTGRRARAAGHHEQLDRPRALKHPRRIGWRVHTVRLRAGLEAAASWSDASPQTRLPMPAASAHR